MIKMTRTMILWVTKPHLSYSFIWSYWMVPECVSSCEFDGMKPLWNTRRLELFCFHALVVFIEMPWFAFVGYCAICS